MLHFAYIQNSCSNYFIWPENAVPYSERRIQHSYIFNNKIINEIPRRERELNVYTTLSNTSRFTQLI
jgi:hypothetical protein